MRHFHKSVVVALAALGSTVPAWAVDARVSGIEAKRLESGVEVSVFGTDLKRPRVIRAAGLYILEFDASLATRKQAIDLNLYGVRRAELFWYTPRPQRVRMALRVEEGVEPELISRDGTWVVMVGQGSTQTASTVKSSMPQPLEPTEAQLKPNGTLPAVRANTPQLSPDDTLKEVPKVEQVQVTNPQKNSRKAVAKVPPPVEFEAPAVKPVQLGTGSVNLDFVNTDVVQVLKALALQTRQNILIAAEASSVDKPNRVTISLSNVSLEQALNYVTAMAGLRYAKIDNAFVVAPDRNFSDVVRKVVNKNANSMEYRVVNLNSGEASLIKESTIRALPADGLNGFYEIVVSDDQKEAMSGSTADKGTAPTRSRSNYLILVGEPARLDLVEKYVRDMDSKLTKASNDEDTGTMVIPIQSGESKQIREAIEKHLSNHPRASSFMIRESDAGEASKLTGAKVISIMGPRSYLPKIEALAREMDEGFSVAKGITYTPAASGIDLKDEVITINHTEPTLVMQRIKERFPNVRVWTLPDPVTPQASGNVSSSSSQSSSGGGSGSQGEGGSTQGNGGGAPATSGGGNSGQSGSQSSSSTTSSSQNVTGQEPMRLLVQAPPSVIAQLKQFIELIDVEPPVIALEMRVLELSKEDTERIGLDFSWLNSVGGTIFRFNQGSGDSVGTAGNFGTGTGINQGFGTNGGGSFNFLATLDKLDTGRKLIARPNALIQDGRGTQIFVGDTIRYIKSIQSTQNGITAQTDELKVGVNFDIHGRISPSGRIHLTVGALFNVLKGFTSVPGGGSLPQTADRSMNQPIDMQDGETVAIGGLIQDQDRRSYGGIPVLKDLPIIGRLFGRTDNQRTRTEIVFFVTAKRVNPTNRPFLASPRTSQKAIPDPMSDYLMNGATPTKKKG